jgi:hypothetical protein
MKQCLLLPHQKAGKAVLEREVKVVQEAHLPAQVEAVDPAKLSSSLHVVPPKAAR